MEKVCIITLGCKVNQYESGSILKVLRDKGYDVTEEHVFADKYIINTCAVTNEAERKSRNAVTKCLKMNPNAKIYVLGCASEHSSEHFLNKKNVVYVNGNFDKIAVTDFPEKSILMPQEKEFDDRYVFLSDRTRAYVKVQDGCNNFCSYCIIPYLRGRSRSRTIDSIKNEIVNLPAEIKEVVIVGINLSDYDGGNLKGLMEELSLFKQRFRLGSLEVNAISDDFLNTLKGMKNFCPHFHLSLQSGSNNVLKAMNRHYTSEEYMNAVKKIRMCFPETNITTDVIVGYPTESDEDFDESLKFCKEVGFGDMHIFPYSKRTGTVAEKLYKDLSSDIKKSREQRLKAVKEEKRLEFLNSLIGKKFSLLVETEKDGYSIGYTENYIKCYIKKNDLQNSMLEVVLTGIYDDGMLCKEIGD